MGLESATYISELNSSNPTATDLEAQGDDHLRLLKATLQATFPSAAKATYIQQAQADVASATTTDLGAATTDYVRITGTTTITGFGTVAAGVRRVCRMEGAVLLTYNATSLILPGAANITTAANDRFEAISLGSGNWFVLWFQRTTGLPLSVPFAATTAMLFVQTAAPTGWTKVIAVDDRAIRLTNGTASSGGSLGFSGAFAARSISQANLPSGVTISVTGTATNANGSFVVRNTNGAITNRNIAETSTTPVVGNNGFAVQDLSSYGVSASGSLGGSGSTMDFAVAYIDVIHATKD